MEYIIFVVSVIAVIIVAKILSWPLKKILKLILNTVIGLALVLVINTFGVGIGLHIPFNVVTSIVVGTLGIPGVLRTCYFKLYFLIDIVYIFVNCRK